MKTRKLFCQTAVSVAFGAAIAVGTSGNVQAATLTSSQLPTPTGRYQVGTTSYHLTDSNREETLTADPTDNRELMTQVWYPAEVVSGATAAPYMDDAVVAAIAQQAGVRPDDLVSLFNLIQPSAVAGAAITNDQASYPVLLYSHGAGGRRTENTFLAQELASHGYIVVSVDHTYDAIATDFPNGRTVPQSPEYLAAATAAILSPDLEDDRRFFGEATQLRAADASFVLDELERLNASEGLFSGHLDLSRVGIFGHSLGGATAAEAMRLDSRFDVGIDMDGSLWTDIVNVGLDRPFMLMHQDVGDELPADLNSFYNNLQNDAYNLSIEGTKHGNFTDSPLLASALSAYAPELADLINAGLGSIDSLRGFETISAYNLAFFDKYLKNENQPLLNGASPDYPEVGFEFRDGDRTSTSVPEPSTVAGLMAMIGAGLLFKHKRNIIAIETTSESRESQMTWTK